MNGGDAKDGAGTDPASTKEQSKQGKKEKLPAPWDSAQVVIWMLGLALLAWMNWWWPGILVLTAISVVTQVALERYFSQRQPEAQAPARLSGSAPDASTGQMGSQQPGLDAQRSGWLPAVCPQCGAPLGAQSVRWSGPDSGNCPYCNALLRPFTR